MEVINRFLAAVVREIINPLMLLLATGAFVLFLWGVFQFIAHAGDESKRSEGKQAILWGLVGLVIIFSAYGLMNTVLNLFSLDPINKLNP
jgi:hypothetical protein